jgi:hypothetical protein
MNPINIINSLFSCHPPNKPALKMALNVFDLFIIWDSYKSLFFKLFLLRRIILCFSLRPLFQTCFILLFEYYKFWLFRRATGSIQGGSIYLHLFRPEIVELVKALPVEKLRLRNATSLVLDIIKFMLPISWISSGNSFCNIAAFFTFFWGRVSPLKSILILIQLTVFVKRVDWYDFNTLFFYGIGYIIVF